MKKCSQVSKREILFQRLSGHLSGIPGWIKRVTIFAIGVIQQTPIWKMGAIALPTISARIRSVNSAIGRKNWLFNNSLEGANASIVVYTMVELSKAHGLNIYGYLKFMLGHRTDKDMTDKQLAELAPWSEKLQSIKNRKRIIVNYFNSQWAGVILYLTALTFSTYN